MRLSKGLGLILIATFLSSAVGWAQNRVDLDDLEVKGDLLNDNRLRMSAREPNAMADRVKYRLQYREEILEGLKSEGPRDTAPLDQSPIGTP